MLKLCINSRDELIILDLGLIAFFQANGNYTQVQYIGGASHLLTLGLSKVEELIRMSWPKTRPSTYVRLGRSLIINQTYLTEVSTTRQKIVLSDHGQNTYAVAVPKPMAKAYKARVAEFLNPGTVAEKEAHNSAAK